MGQHTYQDDFETIEKETKYTIIKMEDEKENSEAKHILDDAMDELNRLNSEFRHWLLNNVNSKETKERLAKLKHDCANLLMRTREKISDFQSREDVQNGKDKVVDVTTKFVQYVHDGLDDVLQNGYVAGVRQTVNTTIDSMKNDDRVKKNVYKMKKGTLKVAESAFNGLKRVLDTDDDGSQKG